MGDLRRSVDSARDRVTDALSAGKRRSSPPRMRAAGRTTGVLAMQRAAGNAAVNALVAAKLRGPGEQAASDIDKAIREIKRDEPSLEIVESGLKRAKDAGIPVDLEGKKPPPSALAVTKTGFGPGSVPTKKPPPPPKEVPKTSKLGKAAAKAPAPLAKKGGAAPGGKQPAPGGGGGSGGGSGGGGGGAGLVPGAQVDPLKPPVPPSPLRPEEDPAFTQVTGSVKKVAEVKKAHPPAAAKAKESQEAAQAPEDDLSSQAKAAKADSMDAQQPGSFDKKAFIAAVKAAIEAKSPKTLKEADDYKKSGKAGEVKGEVQGLVSQGKGEQTKDIETATDAAPDTSKAVPKAVTPMGDEDPGPAAKVPAAGAVPKPAPAEQTNLEAGKHEVNNEMASADVDEKQIEESGEPEWQKGLADKKEAEKHAETAPAEFRAQEKEALAQNKAEAEQTSAEGTAGMQSAKGAALAKLVADKGKTKAKDESKRGQVTAKIQGIFDATETAVKKILDGIDPKVEKAFERGEKKARAIFENFVDAKMSAYKRDRYGGWLGPMKWAKDKLLGMPDKVNEFYEAGREIYLKEMDKVIAGVADIVGGDLTAAKKRIAKGRADIAAYVKSLPADLKKVGAQASEEINEGFNKLEEDVQNKQDSVVDTLATKYVESRKALDARIEELQAANRGLVDKAIGAIKAIINTIKELAAMLKNVLARAAGVVGAIIKAPVKFLGNLIAGVKGGIMRFKDNILEHLRKGLMGWLFGALAEGGVELPESFDLKGIIKLLASIFGLTWRNIRTRLVKQIGEKAMGAVEKGVGIFQTIANEGVGGLWEMLLEKLGDVKEMILEQVKDFVVTKIITAGITWLIGLLNPAAAFIKACKLIYDVVMFFVNNAARIAKFVNTILDSVSDIVAGNVSGVVAKIENVLSQMVPIIIGFLASVIGLGGIGQKVRKIVTALKRPVNKALDFVIKKGLKLAGPLIRGLKGIGRKVKAKVAAGKAWVKGKVEAGKEWVRGKARSVRDRFRRDGGSGNAPPAATSEGTAKLDAALLDARRDAEASPGMVIAPAKLEEIKRRHGLASLTENVSGPRPVVTAQLQQKSETLTPEDSTLPGHARDGDGVLPGRTGPYSSLSGKQDERTGQFAFLRVYAEHVLPRNFVDAFLRAMGFSGMPPRGLDYQSAETVVMYQGAKSTKDSSDTHWTEAVRQAEAHARVLRDPQSSQEARSGAHQDLNKEVERRAHASLIEADKAAELEQQGYGALRGPDAPGGAPSRRPSRSQISSAVNEQLGQFKELITNQAFELESGQSPNAPVNVNSATSRELQRLLGVGPSIAAAIIAERAKSGPFASADDLLRVPGIGSTKVEWVRENVTF